jgi:hypothetical protein
MVGLLDIAPPGVEKVAGVDVRGIGIKGVIALMRRFPELKTLLAGGKLDAGRLIELAPDAVAAIIAIGCGNINSPEAEAVASDMGLEMQTEFVETIYKLTMPSGFGPFVERLERLGLLEKGSVMQAMNSDKPSNTLLPTGTG